MNSFTECRADENPAVCWEIVNEWILCQFGTTRSIAEKAYQTFVQSGIRQESIWKALKAQSILGKDEFTTTLMDYLMGKRDIPELPKIQRYADRPSLTQIFSGNIFQDIGNRNEKIQEAVQRYGYRQREVADYLDMHFNSISRILCEKT
jgi:hypothetical protein